MKVRKMKISKLERIPKVGTLVRDSMMGMITDLPEYINAINRGLRFYTKDELESIESKYADGMSWDNIESELSSKGSLMKHSTFRKYMQDGIIPKAKGYRTTENGRVAIYESNIIRHLNFVNFFYNVTDAPMIDELIRITGVGEITYKDGIESVLEGTGNLYLELLYAVSAGKVDASEAIDKALAKRKDKDMVLNMLDKIRAKYLKYLEKDLHVLFTYLESNTMWIMELPIEKTEKLREVQS